MADTTLQQIREPDALARLTGTPLYPSSAVPEGTIVHADGAIYFHSRISMRGKMRRGHGRARRAPRRWKVKQVLYRPDYDRLAALGSRTEDKR